MKTLEQKHQINLMIQLLNLLPRTTVESVVKRHKVTKFLIDNIAHDNLNEQANSVSNEVWEEFMWGHSRVTEFKEKEVADMDDEAFEAHIARMRATRAAARN